MRKLSQSLLTKLQTESKQNQHAAILSYSVVAPFWEEVCENVTQQNQANSGWKEFQLGLERQGNPQKSLVILRLKGMNMHVCLIFGRSSVKLLSRKLEALYKREQYVLRVQVRECNTFLGFVTMTSCNDLLQEKGKTAQLPHWQYTIGIVQNNSVFKQGSSECCFQPLSCGQLEYHYQYIFQHITGEKNPASLCPRPKCLKPLTSLSDKNTTGSLSRVVEKSDEGSRSLFLCERWSRQQYYFQ